MAPKQGGDETMAVRLVSCWNDAGVRVAARLLRRYGAVILCPPTCDT